MRFMIHTLGCKINQYESQSLRESWLARGFVECASDSEAQLVLVHTCAVTSGAVADSRAAVRRAGRDAPGARILVAGCAAQLEPDEFRLMPGVVLTATQSEKPGLADWPDLPRAGEAGLHARPDLTVLPTLPDLTAHAGQPGTEAARPGPHPSEAAWPDLRHPSEAARPCLPPEPPGPTQGPTQSPAQSPAQGPAGQADRAAWPNFSIKAFHRARPVLKVQDGCSHGCTYCVVPRTRGGARSRPLAAIMAEAERLLDAGHREIVLAGINLGQFELDGGHGDFWDMLALVDKALAPRWAGQARLRLSSLDPGMLSDKAIDVLGGCAMLCEHLHLSMQSGDPGVLAAMGRTHYQPERVLGFLDRLGRVWPVFALGADLLAGFPGETDEAFATTLNFCRAAPLTYAHVFPYSKRPGTVAARLPQKPGADVKKARARTLRLVLSDKKAAFIQRLAGLASLVVAPEGTKPLRGVCQYYVECQVDGQADGTAASGMELVRARPVQALGETLLLEAL